MVILDKDLLPSDMTFGIELECIGSKAKKFLKDNPTVFKTVKDDSLDDRDGIEFVSPIMRYNYDDLSTIQDTLEFLKSNGFKVDDSCGGHIHYGASYLKNLKELLNLLVIYKYFEKEFYIISNSGGEKIRSKSSNYASSICNLISFVELIGGFEKTTTEHIGWYTASYKAKTFGLNIGNIGNQDKNTVEFRIPNGTL